MNNGWGDWVLRCNGPADTEIMYKDEEVYSWDDIVKIHTKTDKN